MEQLDTWLSIIDIILCIIDICLIVYLFFYRLPHEQKKKFSSRLAKRRKGATMPYRKIIT